MRHQIRLPQASRSQASSYSPRTIWPLDTPRPSASRACFCWVVAIGGGLRGFLLFVAPAMVLILLIFAQGRLRAQQAPGQGWPQSVQYSQGSPAYSGQYPASGRQPYSQQPYSAPGQAPTDQQNAQGYAPPDNGQSQPLAQPLAPEQLQQLVAPIALYPDTLVAQVLAAATYPAQVAGADHWLQSQGYASADQIAAGADAQTWDPSVKALTAFPQVLAQMDRNLQWTTDLGNAYYNQPQDVLETVQVMRQRAQAAGSLQNTPQEPVSYNQGYIQLAPPDPQTVYVPAYNPWEVYGQPVAPYQDYSLLSSLESFAGSSPVRFGLGIAMSAFSHTPFGWATWALDWLTQSVLFNHSDYSSNSTSVAHWGPPSRGRPQPEGIARQRDAYNRPQAGYGRPATEFSRQVYARQPVRNPENEAQGRPYAAYRSDEGASRGYPEQRGNYDRNFVRSMPQPYNRLQAPVTARQQADARSGYGFGFNGNSAQGYASRPASAYANPQQNWRSAAPGPQRGDFAQRSYSGERSSSASADRGFGESKPAHSGGFHLFGGGHNGEKSYSHGGGHAPKSLSSGKSYRGGGKSFSKGHSGGGGHSGGHHGGGHHH